MLLLPCVTYFKVKICSRCVLLGICCASMVRYKICRLLEHRWRTPPDDRRGFFQKRVIFPVIPADISYGEVCPIGGAV